jgi:1-acyl-sn-glycerol-3-phosphate acyltransferase
MGGLLLSLLVFPLTFLFVRSPAERKQIARSCVGHAFSLFVRMMRVLGVIGFQIEGLQHARKSGNYLIVANHPSLIDVVFLVSIFPMADCVVKKAVVENPFMRGVAGPTDYISNDDAITFLETCVDRLKTGASLVLFPEGTRTAADHILRFKMGAASIAVRSGVDILPVVIKCSPPDHLSKHKPWYWIPETKPDYCIQLQAPVSQESLIGSIENQREATQKLNEALKVYFEHKLA